MDDKYINVLRNCGIFEEIELYEQKTILDCLKIRIRNYEKNSLVVLAGDRIEEFGIVLEGNVTVTREGAGGDRMIIDVFGPGEMFGEVVAFAGVEKWPVTVIAMSDCKVALLSPQAILDTCRNQCEAHKKLIFNILRIISGKALLLNRKLQYLTMKNIREKISSYLLEQYKMNGRLTFMLPLKRNELADFLNVERPSLSREMCKMRDEGIIDFHRQSVKIKNLNALITYAPYILPNLRENSL